MKHNTINLYKHFCNLIENPKGNDILERESIKQNAIKGKEDIERRFRTAKKYKDDPEIQALLGNKPKVEETKPEPKSDGKKSKG